MGGEGWGGEGQGGSLQKGVALTALSWSAHSPSSSWLRENRSSSCVAMATTFSWWAPSSSRHCVIVPAVKEYTHKERERERKQCC